jgi:hypothetical protein
MNGLKNTATWTINNGVCRKEGTISDLTFFTGLYLAGQCLSGTFRRSVGIGCSPVSGKHLLSVLAPVQIVLQSVELAAENEKTLKLGPMTPACRDHDGPFFFVLALD